MANTLRVRYGPAVLLLTVLSLGISCAPPPPRDTHDADVRSITEGEALWVRDWSTRDTEGIVARYADEAMVMAPNSAPANGREAIREMVKQYVRDGNFAFNFETKAVEVARSGDYGYVQGTYTLTMTGRCHQEARHGSRQLSQNLSKAVERRRGKYLTGDARSSLSRRIATLGGRHCA